MRRAMAVVAALAMLTPSARAADDCKYFSDTELADWTKYLKKPRYPGNDAHTELINYLEAQLEGLKTIDSSIVVEKQAAKTFTRWDFGKPEIYGCDGGPCPGYVWPVAYTGFTDAAGVKGELVDAGTSVGLFHFKKEHAGKIVLLKMETLPIGAMLTVKSDSVIPSWKRLFTGEYYRPVVLEKQLPRFREAEDNGVLGVIYIVDPLIARDQFVPFTRARQDKVPMVFVGRDLGKTLAQMAKNKRQVTIRHEGKLVPGAVTWHLLATVPATKNDKYAKRPLAGSSTLK